jgi:hypothetical protein
MTVALALSLVALSFAAGFAACVVVVLAVLRSGAAAKQQDDRQRAERHKNSPWMASLRR